MTAAMKDFAGNWDDYRTRLVESLESIGEPASGTEIDLSRGAPTEPIPPT
ncbi:hypothetical protein [Streptomyces sp. NPDC057794]